MRLTRRGMFAQGSGTKFIWAVYSLTYGADESTTPYTGSFNLSSASYYKMAAKDYTATSSTFTLTNPVQTTRANLKVGDYLVNVSTSSNTATSGNYLYKITGISGSTISYIRWTPTISKKDTYLYDVSAGEYQYPVNGIQGGYWYVMIKGEVTMHVWDVYAVVIVYGYKDYGDVRATRYIPGSTLYYGDSYTFDKVTGKYSVVNPKTISRTSALENYTILIKKYFTEIPTNDVGVYYDPTGVSGSGFINLYRRYSQPDTTYIVSTSQGAATGAEVESDNRSKYPDNNYVGDFWYVYSHSYLYQI